MKKTSKTSGLLSVLASVIIILVSPNVRGQDDSFITHRFPEGINVGAARGSIALKDRYISGEKYSGNTWTYDVSWARDHEKYIYRLQFQYNSSDRLKNNNARTRVTYFGLNQGFLYPISSGNLFNKPIFIFLGPSADLYYYQNDPVVAIDGFEYVHSIATVFSVGLNAAFTFPVTPKYHLEAGLSTSILSMVIRSVDDEESDESMAKLLPFFKGLNSSFLFANRYYLLKNLSLSLGYRFQLMQLSPWDPLVYARDEFTFVLTFKF